MLQEKEVLFEIYAKLAKNVPFGLKVLLILLRHFLDFFLKFLLTQFKYTRSKIGQP